MGSNELNDPRTCCLKITKLVKCKKFALNLQLLALKVTGRGEIFLLWPFLDFLNMELKSFKGGQGKKFASIELLKNL
jgi:hypothetical protein